MIRQDLGGGRAAYFASLGSHWGSDPGWRGLFLVVNTAKFLVLQGETGARGIRTLVAGFPTNRISRPSERRTGKGMSGHSVFEIEVKGAPQGRLGHPCWDSVGSGVSAFWVLVEFVSTRPEPIHVAVKTVW